jgi:uncharacterized protein (DUF1330 family)
MAAIMPSAGGLKASKLKHTVQCHWHSPWHALAHPLRLTQEEIMKKLAGPSLGVLAGVAIGAAAVQGLYAQQKAPVYFVAEITVSDPEGYAKEYAPKAQAIIKSHGGQFLAIGGSGGTGKSVIAFDGDPPKRLVVQRWASMDQIKGWREDPQYQQLREVGKKYATFRSFAVEGLEQ